MSGPEALVPLVSMVGLFATIFGVVYVKSRENMAMIERGVNPKDFRTGPRPSAALRYGLLIAGAALGMLIAFILDISLNHHAVTPNGTAYEKDYPQIYFSLVGLGGGIGLIISYLIERKAYSKKGEGE